jgi:toxin ParE1/3/4
VTDYEIVWRPGARADLRALYDWIAVNSDTSTAFAYVGDLQAHVEELAYFPHRGTPRDDLALGMRTRPFRRRTVVAYRVVETRVEILGLLHAGQSSDKFTEI